MRLVRVQPRNVFLLLATILVLSPLFQSIYKQRDINMSSNPLFVFLLCNILILAIVTGDHRPPNEEVESIVAEDDGGNNYIDIDDHVNGNEDAADQVDESEEEEDAEYDSDGYDEDDDDDGSSDEDGWGDTDESDDNLRTRVEDFIDRVYKGWQEDRLRDSQYNPMQIFGCINPL